MFEVELRRFKNPKSKERLVNNFAKQWQIRTLCLVPPSAWRNYLKFWFQIKSRWNYAGLFLTKIDFFNSITTPFNSTWPWYLILITTYKQQVEASHLAWRCCQWFPVWWQLRAQSWPGWQLGSRQLPPQPRTDRRSLTADFLKKKVGILTKLLRHLLYVFTIEKNPWNEIFQGVEVPDFALLTLNESRNQYRGIDSARLGINSARLGIDSWAS